MAKTKSVCRLVLENTRLGEDVGILRLDNTEFK
jgi:hypothetical protein